MNIVIKRPIISEKSMKMASQGYYTFAVEKDTTKPVIARAIEERFSVNVVSINTINVKDEIRTQRSRRGQFVKPGFKKAIVALRKGQKIGLFEPEAAKEDQVSSVKGQEGEVKEKKSLLKGTKVKIEKVKEEKSK